MILPKNMENNNNTFVAIIIIAFLFSNCNNNVYLTDTNSLLKKQRIVFSKNYKKQHLLSHFPKEISKKSLINFYVMPPSCPPDYECIAQSGVDLLVLKREDKKENIDNLLTDSSIYVTNYLMTAI